MRKRGALHNALAEIADTLTPAQRQRVGDFIIQGSEPMKRKPIYRWRTGRGRIGR